MITRQRLQPAFEFELSIDTINGQARFGPSVGHLFCLSHSFCSYRLRSGILEPSLAGVVDEYWYTISIVDFRPDQKLPADCGCLHSHTTIFPWSVWKDDFWSILGSSYCN